VKRTVNFDNLVPFGVDEDMPAAVTRKPRGSADAAPKKTRRPHRPKRVDTETGQLIPGSCYDPVSPEAGHWRLNVRRVAAWRAELAVVPELDEPTRLFAPSAPAPVAHGLNDRHAHRAHVALSVGFHAYEWVATAAGTSIALGWALGVPLATLVICTSFALSMGVGAHMKWRRRFLMVALNVGIVFAGFIAGYNHQAPADDANLRAREAHARFESEVWVPAQLAARTAEAQVKGLADRLEAECSRDYCGPKAAEVETEKAEAEVEAAPLVLQRDALAPYFENAPTDPAALHANDVAAAAKAGVPAPARSDYVEPALLLPFNRLAQGDPFAWFALMLALFFDLPGLVLSSGLHRGTQ
jgi:hypothetical protein